MSDGLVSRARITNYRTGQFVELSLNPGEVGKKLGSEITSESSPGRSDPMKKWASGKGTDVDFTILVHALAHYEKFGIQIINEAQNDFLQDAEGWSIAGQLEFYEAFHFPSDPDLPGGTGGGDFLVFTMGRYFRSAKYLCTDLDIKIKEWNEDLDPTMAEVSFKITRVEEEQRFSNQIFSFQGRE